ncbi:hypothetical protein B0H17DRAFT_1178173 [Mycena rosella]|uniref:Uncharacterized protein n=1 Tax=Mycena rosella TaxID=1033263 RepID=A0AAD7DR20_MYCRO|nr:hypothetical protein B0H17DRAFT_1178173 [Mycena rosella]
MSAAFAQLSESTSYLDKLLTNARKRLVESSDSENGYTKTVAVSDLTWHRIGNFGDQVVSVAAAEKTKKAVEEHLQDSSKPEATAPPPFVFSTIVFITYEDFYGDPATNWRTPSPIAQKLSDAKLTFTGKAPADPVLAKDFHDSRAKLEKIFELAKTSVAHTRQGVIITPPGQALCDRKLRFTHRLFEKVEEGDEDDPKFPPEFKIQQWPVQTEEAIRALAEIKCTHRVIPLQAYDATPEGQIIRPVAYKEQLRGALAQIKFTLSHWDIRKDRRDVFAADVVHIRILNPPANYPATPNKKRMFSAVDTLSGDISPKKARAGPSV